MHTMDPSDSDVMRLRSRWRGQKARAWLDAALDAVRQAQDFGSALADMPFVLEVEGGRDLRGAPLSGCDLGGADLVGANLQHAELAGADLRRARLCRAELSGATLRDAQLDGADLELSTLLFVSLERASLAGAKLVRANLMGANLRGADLRGADLRWAVLTGANLDGANLERAQLDHARRGPFAPEDIARPAVAGEPARPDSRSGSAALDAAIDRLYHVFAADRQPPRAHVSPYAGITEADTRRLYRAPLRQLGEDDLATYARRALSVWGDPAEFRHYLPRLLELIARGRRGWTDADLLLGKLEQAGWKSWPEGEQAAVERYLRCLFEAVLGEFPRWPRACDVLRGVSLSGEPLDWYLHTWRQDARPSALYHLAELILDEQVSLLSAQTVDRGFWHPSSLEPMRAFLSAPERAAQLEEAFLAGAEAPYAHTLASVADILRQL